MAALSASICRGNSKVDLAEARHKHLEQDHRLHDAVEILLNQATELNLDEEEKSVLNILFNHRYPRRQLFWAYQAEVATQ